MSIKLSTLTNITIMGIKHENSITLKNYPKSKTLRELEKFNTGAMAYHVIASDQPQPCMWFIPIENPKVNNMALKTIGHG